MDSGPTWLSGCHGRNPVTCARLRVCPSAAVSPRLEMLQVFSVITIWRKECGWAFFKFIFLIPRLCEGQ